jgi:uncharacterized protein YqeY
MYREKIDTQIATAMKNGDSVKLTVWRAIETEFVKYKTSGSGVELTDEKELQIITKMVQQRKDSIEQYKNAGREELANAEQAELNILTSLLPKEPTESDILSMIKTYADKKNDTLTMKDMKDVMTFVKTKFPTVNGGLVSKLFRENFI